MKINFMMQLQIEIIEIIFQMNKFIIIMTIDQKIIITNHYIITITGAKMFLNLNTKITIAAK